MTLVGAGFWPLCKYAVGVVYSSSRLGKTIFDLRRKISRNKIQNKKYFSSKNDKNFTAN